MISLYKLITKTNLKSPTLAFPLIFPLIFVLLYSVGIRTDLNSVEIDKLVASFFVTILAVQTMQSGLMGFGINFISIKKSVLLKRFGATELTKKDVIFSLLFFGLTLWIISVVWIFFIILLFNWIGVFYSLNGDVKVTGTSAVAWIQYVNWGKMILATLVMLYVSYSLGLFFTSIAHDDQMYMGMAMLYFFFAAFIGGILFPGDIPVWMEYTGYIVPHSYVGYLYDWAAGFNVANWKLITGVIVPIVFGTFMVVLATFKLKFD